jgi:hypothetical protein
MINHQDTKDTKTGDESVALKQSRISSFDFSLFFLVPFVFVVTIL